MIDSEIAKKYVSPLIEGWTAEAMFKMIQESGPQVVMEIGTLQMATAARLSELGCEVHSFDVGVGAPFGWPEVFNVDRIAIYERIKEKYPKLHFYPNSNRVYDSYNWSLMKMIEGLKIKEMELFDLVFSDGAHVYQHDCLSFFLSGMLLKKGGMIIFDNYDWGLGREEFPEINNHYTEEQLKTSHVSFIVETVVARHPDYRRLGRETFIKER